MRGRAALVTAVLIALVAPVAAGATGDANVAALQVGLTTQDLYAGDVDGYVGPQTLSGVDRLPGASAPLARATRHALGKFGAHKLGSRPLVAGTFGWDVAALQFMLAWHGFPSGAFDGNFGAHTEAALLRFQNWAGIDPIGVAGPQTLAALRSPVPTCPLRLSLPIDAAPGDPFGPRGSRFHPGIDYPAPMRTPVFAAGDGVVVFTGPLDGYGKAVQLGHEQNVITLYAHLSRILVHPGERVSVGEPIGLVGRTGDATGPHLHFEVRVRGAAVDPETGLN